MSLEALDPAKYASAPPEAYEQYAGLLRERSRLIAEGHTGKSFRLIRSGSDAISSGKKISMARGYFLVEVPYETLVELTPDNPIGTVGTL